MIIIIVSTITVNKCHVVVRSRDGGRSRDEKNTIIQQDFDEDDDVTYKIFKFSPPPTSLCLVSQNKQRRHSVQKSTTYDIQDTLLFSYIIVFDVKV